MSNNAYQFFKRSARPSEENMTLTDTDRLDTGISYSSWDHPCRCSVSLTVHRLMPVAMTKSRPAVDGRHRPA